MANSLNFTIEGRKLAQIGDVQRTYLWELIIPDAHVIAPDVFSEEEDFIIRVRSTGIPARGIEPIPSNFMTMTQYFMGKPQIDSNISTTLEEFEDQKVSLFLYSWRQTIFNIGPNPTESVTENVNQSVAGAAAYSSKRSGLARTMYLRMYAYNGDKLPYQVKFINAWPENVESLSLDYTMNESVKYNVSWKFDYWQLVSSAG